MKLIEDVNKKYGNTIIMVTHNEAIKNMADHVIKLRDGAVRHNDINTNKVRPKSLSGKEDLTYEQEKDKKSSDKAYTKGNYR